MRAKANNGDVTSNRANQGDIVPTTHELAALACKLDTCSTLERPIDKAVVSGLTRAVISNPRQSRPCGDIVDFRRSALHKMFGLMDNPEALAVYTDTVGADSPEVGLLTYLEDQCPDEAGRDVLEGAVLSIPRGNAVTIDMRTSAVVPVASSL
ncbi:hypothetical protein A3F37_02040 [Candidatus Saccharibacteria bacterium RIFCSPHIGHO2_12_FULL_41_12]|nr:MAG: hypothetical protein A3F37_02040 [Candidatus Saccharibacteria bacterium RIFCSPHIGHO2_12_FULL_41_12]